MSPGFPRQRQIGFLRKGSWLPRGKEGINRVAWLPPRDVVESRKPDHTGGEASNRADHSSMEQNAFMFSLEISTFQVLEPGSNDLFGYLHSEPSEADSCSTSLAKIPGIYGHSNQSGIDMGAELLIIGR